MSLIHIPDEDDVRVLATAVQLDLSPQRLERLTENFANFLTRFAEVWEIDAGEYEPPAITFEEQET